MSDDVDTKVMVEVQHGTLNGYTIGQRFETSLQLYNMYRNSLRLIVRTDDKKSKSKESDDAEKDISEVLVDEDSNTTGTGENLGISDNDDSKDGRKGRKSKV